jgi:hypothetical protein
MERAHYQRRVVSATRRQWLQVSAIDVGAPSVLEDASPEHVTSRRITLHQEFVDQNVLLSMMPEDQPSYAMPNASIWSACGHRYVSPVSLIHAAEESAEEIRLEILNRMLAHWFRAYGAQDCRCRNWR